MCWLWFALLCFGVCWLVACVATSLFWLRLFIIWIACAWCLCCYWCCLFRGLVGCLGGVAYVVLFIVCGLVVVFGFDLVWLLFCCEWLVVIAYLILWWVIWIVCLLFAFDRCCLVFVDYLHLIVCLVGCLLRRCLFCFLGCVVGGWCLFCLWLFGWLLYCLFIMIKLAVCISLVLLFLIVFI